MVRTVAGAAHQRGCKRQPERSSGLKVFRPDLTNYPGESAQNTIVIANPKGCAPDLDWIVVAPPVRAGSY